MACCIGVRTEEGNREDAPIIAERQHNPREHNQVHKHFRLDDRDDSRRKKIMGCVIKWSANSIGIWEPRGCCLILSVFFGVVCTYQLVYDLMTVVGCHGFDCGFLEKEQAEEKKIHRNITHKPYRTTANTVYTLASIGGWLSYIILLYCLLRMNCLRDNALAPSKAMFYDLSRTQVTVLFICLTITCLLYLTGVGLFYYIIHNQPKGSFFDELVTGVGCQFIAQWCAIVACTVFGISSFGLGTFSDYTIQRLRDMDQGTHLDEAITIHEELCSVVGDTVSAFCLWFIFHWLLYGATCVIAIVYIDEEITLGSPWINSVYIGTFVAIHFLLFLAPCFCAAHITAKCGGLFR